MKRGNSDGNPVRSYDLCEQPSPPAWKYFTTKSRYFLGLTLTEKNVDVAHTLLPSNV